MEDDRQGKAKQVFWKKTEREEGKSAKKAARAEKKAARKAQRTEKRAARKAAYRALSRKGRLFYWGRRCACLVLILAVLGSAGAYVYPRALWAYGTWMLQYIDNREVSGEAVLEEAPVSEAQAQAVDAMKGYGADDTWAVYVYACGSNLEAGTYSSLSPLTKYLLASPVEEYQAEFKAEQNEAVQRFVSELLGQGTDLPAYMYLNTPMALPETSSAREEEGAPEIAGGATADIREMLAAELSDQIRIVIQTGGSPAWEEQNVNPNRAQRFLIDAGGLRQIDDQHIQNMADPETLSDFLRFCEETAPADHKILIFWDHGSGAFGFAADMLYGYDMLTLAELEEAFADVYQANPEKPPFELIGFDACLMASAEVAESLHGYGRYLAASEEIEPGEGWDYTPWLNALSANPGMNGAQVGKQIADSYVEFYARRNVRRSVIGLNTAVCFSIVDINQANAAYEAYAKLLCSALRDTAEDVGVLSALGKASEKAVRFGQSSYETVNTVDLGGFMENLQALYPEESAAVLEALSGAVAYNRASSYAEGSNGLSVYFPTSVPNTSSLAYYLDYINNICEDDRIRALYYYKIGGCLNEELGEAVKAAGFRVPERLDTAPLSALQGAALSIGEDGSLSLSLSEEAARLMQSSLFYLVRQTDEGRLYLGGDRFAEEEDGLLRSSFDGKWITINGNVLLIEPVGISEDMIQYRSEVKYNGKDAYLMLGREPDTESFSILGIYTKSSQESSGIVAERNLETVKPGEKLQPVYQLNRTGENQYTEVTGKEFRYQRDSRIGYEALTDGSYLVFFGLTDMRGDIYYSPVAELHMKNGEIASVNQQTELKVSSLAQ